jgi:D-glycerate 3-kinase
MTSAEQQFLQRNRLPDSYLDSANRWFTPLLKDFQNPGKRALMIGINGTQGSGKSTLADYLCTMLGESGLTCVSLSLDDFYLTRAERESLAARVHPLLKTRGVPGTHDIALAMQTIDSLSEGSGQTLIPRFDKSTDDRHQNSDCDQVSGAVDIIIFEGWCVGAKPQPEEALEQAVNNLELERDADGSWRSFVNTALARDYQPLFERIDKLIMLRAPSFKAVFNWRLEQEEKMKARLAEDNETERSGVMSEAQIAEFIAHYQRITEFSLEEMPSRADYLFQLDSQRQIIDAQKTGSETQHS